MPRAPWVRRRRTTDSPRPAGRRWTGRLRRGGSFARQMLLVRVGRRRHTGAGTRTGVSDGGLDLSGSRLVVSADPHPIAPVSPAFPPGAPPAQAVPLDDAVRDRLRVDDDQTPHSIPLLPGERTLRRRAAFAAANGCTLASLMLGMTAILLSMRGQVHIAAACLVGCVVFDGMDGALARKLGVASPFGAQMDSLADMCSFGIAAPVVVYSSLHATAPSPVVGGVCALVAACAAIRLARFNVSPKDGRFFCGVPTTMAAAVLGLATLIGLRLPGPVGIAAVAVLALAMVSGFPYAKLARIARLPVWVWLIPAVGAFVDYRVTFAGLVAIYLVSGPLIWLRQRQRI